MESIKIDHYTSQYGCFIYNSVMLFKKDNLLIPFENINFIFIKEKRNFTNIFFRKNAKEKYTFQIFLIKGEPISFDFSSKNLSKGIEFQKAIMHKKTEFNSSN
jgi:hypothetical protein